MWVKDSSFLRPEEWWSQEGPRRAKSAHRVGWHSVRVCKVPADPFSIDPAAPEATLYSSVQEERTGLRHAIPRFRFDKDAATDLAEKSEESLQESSCSYGNRLMPHGRMHVHRHRSYWYSGRLSRNKVNFSIKCGHHIFHAAGPWRSLEDEKQAMQAGAGITDMMVVHWCPSLFVDTESSPGNTSYWTTFSSFRPRTIALRASNVFEGASIGEEVAQ